MNDGKTVEEKSFEYFPSEFLFLKLTSLDRIRLRWLLVKIRLRIKVGRLVQWGK